MRSLPALRNLGLATLASLSLTGCYYGDVNGASYAGNDCSSRYGDQYWSNDPYAYDDGYYGYDCYDAADYGSGFIQIGFGGGWHQQLYYPGYGLFLFDRFGRRHDMSHDYLSYWGGRRAWWKHHGHRYDDRGYRRGGDGRYDGRHDGRRSGRGYGQGGAPYSGSSDGSWNSGADAAPNPRGRSRDGWRGGRARDGSPGGYAPVAAPPAAAPDAGISPDAMPAPRIRRGGDGNGWGGNGAGQGGGNWVPPTAGAPPQENDVPMQQLRGPRIQRYMPPTIGNDGATVTMPQPAPSPRAAPPAAPEVSYAPPPPARQEEQSRDHGGPIRED